MEPTSPPDRYTYVVHLAGPHEGLGLFLDDLSLHDGFISAVQENPNASPTQPMIVRVVLAQLALWKWSDIASANLLILVGLEGAYAD